VKATLAVRATAARTRAARRMLRHKKYARSARHPFRFRVRAAEDAHGRNIRLCGRMNHARVISNHDLRPRDDAAKFEPGQEAAGVLDLVSRETPDDAVGGLSLMNGPHDPDNHSHVPDATADQCCEMSCRPVPEGLVRKRGDDDVGEHLRRLRRS